MLRLGVAAVVALTAFLAVCSADKLDRTYLPPLSAQTAGGSPGAIQAPFPSTRAQGNQGLGGLPSGSFENDYDGVVVEAAAAGTRTNDPAASGLGAPRISYGSMNSKVGAAAFKVAQANQGFGQQPSQQGQSSQGFGQNAQLNQGFGGQAFQGAGNQFDSQGQFQGSQTGVSQFSPAPERPERPQAAAERNANIVRYESQVDTDRFNYAFETDNGITAEENGVDNNGIQAQGGFSYTGDDGQVYSITYTADEGGYKPQGSHLPTPPPIPEEILRALEKNAQDEAAGIIDDGSYNAQKYNTGSGYTQSEIDSGKYNGAPSRFGSRPGLNTPSGPSGNIELSNLGQTSNTFVDSAESNENPSFGSQNSGASRPSGNNFAFNNDYSTNNRFENGKPQVPSNAFDKQVDASAQAEDQGQDAPSKPESSNNAPSFGFAPSRRPSFGNYNQNRPTNTFGQNVGTFQQNRQPFEKPQQTGTQDSSNIESNDSESLSNIRPTEGAFNQQRPSSFNSFSGSSAGFNKEYLPPFRPNTQPQGPAGSTFESSKLTAQSTASSQTIQPNFGSQSFTGFQQNVQKPNRFSSNFGQPSRFGSQANNAFEKAPTSPPDTTLTTPFESTDSQDSTTTLNSESSGPSRVEADAQKEQLSNLQSSQSTSSSASSFASSQQGFASFPQGTAQFTQQNRVPAFGINQNRPRPNTPFSPPTSRPSFNQPQYQGADDSYYYNQPSQPFNTPALQNQGGFPGVPSNQFNSGFPSTTVTYPRPPTVAPAVATSSTQKDLGLNPVPQFGGVTDATASSFTSSEGQASSFSTAGNKIPSRPNAQLNFGQKPNEPEAPEDGPAVSSQQYQGEIYEYKKPAMMLPAEPEKDTTSPPSRFGNSPVQSQYQSRPQFGQTAQQNKPFSPDQSSQFEAQAPESSSPKVPCCKRPSGRPAVFPVNQNFIQPDTSKDDQAKPAAVFNPNAYQPSNTNFAGAGEAFGGPRKPPSFNAETGYHY